MCINPVDVTSVKCLFYQEVLNAVKSISYGISCNDDDLLTVKDIFDQWNFECYSNDFIRNLIIDSDVEICTERDEAIPGIIG